MTLRVLTISEIKAARRCDRLHDIRYNRGLVLRAAEDDARSFGSMFHYGLEPWFLALLHDPGCDPLPAALDGLRSEPCPRRHAPLDRDCLICRGEGKIPRQVDPYTLVRAEVMMIAYHAKWAGEPIQPLAVEKEFRTPLVNPDTGASSRTFRLGGKIDAVYRRAEFAPGEAGVIEHKTSSEDIAVGSEYWRRLRMDGQVSTYFDALPSLGYQPREILYDVIGVPGQRPGKATPEASRKYTAKGALYANQRAEDETPEEYRARLTAAVAEEPSRYLVRTVVPRLERDLEEFRLDTWQQAEKIRESLVRERHPRNSDACKMYGRMCDYFSVCAGLATLDDRSQFEQLPISGEGFHTELTATGSPE